LAGPAYREIVAADAAADVHDNYALAAVVNAIGQK
jgi:hypothetical protein